MINTAACPGAPEMTLDLLSGIVLLPILFAIASFFVAAGPVTAAAILVGVKVGLTGRLSWTETVILSIICLVFAYGAKDEQYYVNTAKDYWEFITLILPLLPSSLFAALTLRFLIKRLGLIQ